MFFETELKQLVTMSRYKHFNCEITYKKYIGGRLHFIDIYTTTTVGGAICFPNRIKDLYNFGNSLDIDLLILKYQIANLVIT